MAAHFEKKGCIDGDGGGDAGGVFVNGFVNESALPKNERNEKDEEERKRKQTVKRHFNTAVGVIEAYVSKRWISPLRRALDIVSEDGVNKKKRSVQNISQEENDENNVSKETQNNNIKRSKSCDMDDVLDLISGAQRASNTSSSSSDNKPKSKSHAQRRLAKTNTKNMKSMFSYFGKK